MRSHPITSDAVERLASATGRRTFKTLRNHKDEPVWPPYVEAALIDGLEDYRPSMTGDPLTLSRFPMRNRFLADYIFKHTSKLRTPKQVGSRIQQLRDTCTDPDIQHLLSRKTYPAVGTHSSSLMAEIKSESSPSPEPSSSYRIVSSSSSAFSDSSSSSGPSFSSSSSGSSSRRSSTSTLYSFDMIPTEISRSPPPLSLHGREQKQLRSSKKPAQTAHLNLKVTSVSTDPTLTRISIFTSLPLAHVDSAVRFTSEVPLTSDFHYCIFTIFDGDVAIHAEDTSLTLVSTSMNGSESNFTYSVNLVPQYWSKLASYDPPTLEQLTIVQEIKRSSILITGPVSLLPPGGTTTVVLKVIYEFKNPAHEVKTEVVEQSLSPASFIPAHFDSLSFYDEIPPIVPFSEFTSSFHQSYLPPMDDLSNGVDSATYYNSIVQQPPLDLPGRYDYMTDTQSLHGSYFDTSDYSSVLDAPVNWSSIPTGPQPCRFPAMGQLTVENFHCDDDSPVSSNSDGSSSFGVYPGQAEFVHHIIM